MLTLVVTFASGNLLQCLGGGGGGGGDGCSVAAVVLLADPFDCDFLLGAKRGFFAVGNASSAGVYCTTALRNRFLGVSDSE